MKVKDTYNLLKEGNVDEAMDALLNEMNISEEEPVSKKEPEEENVESTVKEVEKDLDAEHAEEAEEVSEVEIKESAEELSEGVRSFFKNLNARMNAALGAAREVGAAQNKEKQEDLDQDAAEQRELDKKARALKAKQRKNKLAKKERKIDAATTREKAKAIVGKAKSRRDLARASAKAEGIESEGSKKPKGLRKLSLVFKGLPKNEIDSEEIHEFVEWYEDLVALDENVINYLDDETVEALDEMYNVLEEVESDVTLKPEIEDAGKTAGTVEKDLEDDHAEEDDELELADGKENTEAPKAEVSEVEGSLEDDHAEESEDVSEVEIKESEEDDLDLTDTLDTLEEGLAKWFADRREARMAGKAAKYKAKSRQAKRDAEAAGEKGDSYVAKKALKTAKRNGKTEVARAKIDNKTERAIAADDTATEVAEIKNDRTISHAKAKVRRGDLKDKKLTAKVKGKTVKAEAKEERAETRLARQKARTARMSARAAKDTFTVSGMPKNDPINVSEGIDYALECFENLYALNEDVVNYLSPESIDALLEMYDLVEGTVAEDNLETNPEENKEVELHTGEEPETEVSPELEPEVKDELEKQEELPAPEVEEKEDEVFEDKSEEDTGLLELYNLIDKINSDIEKLNEDSVKDSLEDDCVSCEDELELADGKENTEAPKAEVSEVEGSLEDDHAEEADELELADGKENTEAPKAEVSEVEGSLEDDHVLERKEQPEEVIVKEEEISDDAERMGTGDEPADKEYDIDADLESSEANGSEEKFDSYKDEKEDKEEAKPVAESKSYRSIKEAYLLGKDYFTADTVITESAEVKQLRLKEQLSMLAAREADDALYEAAIAHATALKNLKEAIVAK